MHRLLAGAFACLLSTHAFAASDGTEPDPVLTPGAVRTTDRAEIVGETTAQVRNVSGAEKLAVYRRYGMKGPHDAIPGTDHMAPFEIDHRLPLCSGGSNDITNLWVQAGDGPWTFHDKDRLEDRVCAKLKRGLVTVEQAQAVFLGDWKAGYVAEFGGAPQHDGEAGR
ncbi:HNH endonuclease [Methylobacterium sp. E-005]|uniref:HNH endonuclease signature motif containing protein n=1 Tax=Methylobacterium sp. E-005 TaxID=2836549 RepID=UPI001FBA8E8F|nr:HNH endonuclease signature motif containing protein [Methylobacterium sp. E-005]MCJ2085492.1 HNH endonuclease [Methylobacterium sp. E-005]